MTRSNKKKSKVKGKGKPPVKKAGKAAKKSSATATAAAVDATPAIVEAGALAAPGDVLGQTATHKCGPGTFARDGDRRVAGRHRANQRRRYRDHEGRPPARHWCGRRGDRRRDADEPDERAAGPRRGRRQGPRLPRERNIKKEDALPPGRDASNLDLTAQFAGRDLVRAVVVAVDDAARYHVRRAGGHVGPVRSA